MAKKSQDYIVYLRANNADLKRKLDDSRRKMKSHNSQLKALSRQATGYIAGFFAVGAISSFAKGIVDITGRFQKYAAVLENTLGSGSAAKAALDDIKDFAATTPFQVDQLTESFIKLANQGFVATTSQLTSLGDLASSTGKSFDQLAEAIIDAQVGEFERLKEFGIRAKKQGDQVTFTFKGVQKQVEFTEGAIQEYLLSLGKVEGVSGSMAAISGTLEGKLSNLGDNFDSLKIKIGELVAGPLSNAILGLNDFLSAVQNIDLVVTGLFKDIQDFDPSEIKRLIGAGLQTDTGVRISDIIKPLDSATAQTIQQSYKDAIDAIVKEGETLADATFIVDSYLMTLGDATVQQDNATISIDKLTNSVKKLGGATANIEKDLKPVLDLMSPKGFMDMSGLDVNLDLKENIVSPVTEAGEAMRAEWKKQFDEINAVLEVGIESGIDAFISGLATGGIETALSNLFSVIGGGLKNLGRALVAQGVALKVAQFSLDPFSKIAAGIAAIAAGSLIQSANASIQSGYKGGGGGSSGGGGSFARAQPLNVSLNGKLSISTKELSFALDEFKAKDSRNR